MSHIFISYARKDIDFAGKIVQALAEGEPDAKLDTWIDWKSIPKGEDWEQEIYRGVEEADAFLFLISPDSVVSEMCNKEIDHAVKNGKRILPIVIRDTDPKTVHPEISKRNWIFCRDEQDDFDKAIEETRKTIHTDYEWSKYHTELQVKALKWEQKNDSSRLLRGKELREAEQQLAEVGTQEDPQPTKIQREYILASQRNEERQRRQFTIGLISGLAILAMLAVFAWVQRDTAAEEANSRATAESNAISEANARATAQANADEKARVARAGELAAQAVATRDERPIISYLLGLEAFHWFDNTRTRSVLIDNLTARPQVRQHLTGHLGLIRSIAYSPDGKILASGSEDGNVILWDLATGHFVGKIHVIEDLHAYSLAFSPDGRTLAVGGFEETTLWDVTTYQSVGQPLTEKYGSVDCIAFSPDGKMLATCKYGSVILWDVVSRQPVGQPLTGSDSTSSEKGTYYATVNGIAFSPDGRIFASVSSDGVFLWDMGSSQPDYRLLTGNTGGAHSIAFSHNGNILAVGGSEGAVLWDMVSEQLIGHLRTEYAANQIAFSPDDKMLATSASDTIILWDLNTYQPIGTPFIGHTDWIPSMVFSPDGKTLASGSADKTIILWNVEIRPPIGQQLTGHVIAVESVSFSPDGKILASGSDDRTIILWDMVTKKPIGHPLTGHTDGVAKLTFSPDGKTLISSSFFGNTLSWDLTAPQSSNKLITDNNAGIASVDISSDAKVVAFGMADGSITVWDVPNQQFIYQSLKEHSDKVENIAFGPNGKMMVSASGITDGTIIQWNVDTGKSMGRSVVEKIWIMSMVLSPDGKTLALGGNDGSILLWDVVNNRLSGQRFTKHTQTVYSMAFSPDGKTLASGSIDETIILWDLATGQSIGRPLTGHAGWVKSVAFSPPDGKVLASGGVDNTIILWSLDPVIWIDKTCQRVGRNFTQAEWQQYFPEESYRITCPQYPAGE